MYRVVTKYRNGTERPIVEHGPWHTTLKSAEYWADLLREQGYITSVEGQNGLIHGSADADDNSDFAAALANMA